MSMSEASYAMDHWGYYNTGENVRIPPSYSVWALLLQ